MICRGTGGKGKFKKKKNWKCWDQRKEDILYIGAESSALAGTDLKCS